MKSKNPFKHKVILPWDTWKRFIDPESGAIEDENNTIEWCCTNWGAGGYQKDSHWITLNSNWDEFTDVTFAFRKEEDAMFFILRWL